MTRAVHVLLTIALVGCGSAGTSTVTTTSASWVPAAPPTHAATRELPRLEPGPVNPRVERDLEIAAREARQRDLNISDAIVRGIVNDANLSPRAKHIDVTTSGRHVTLRGDVPSGQERQEIDAKARFTADVLDVDDRIQIVP